MPKYRIALVAVLTAITFSMGSFGTGTAFGQRADRDRAAKKNDTARPKAAQQKPVEGDGQLMAIGGLTAANMYTTYIAIGATADAFGSDVYTAEQVQSIMGSFDSMMDTVKKQLLNVQEKLDDPGDIKYIDEAITIFGLLQEESRQLAKFAASKSQDDYKAYEKARTTVWPRIKKLLGIKE